MNRLLIKTVFLLLATVCAKLALAQDYPCIVTLESSDERTATFTTLGIADKKGDVELNALQSLFYTLFTIGVDGVNDGVPLIQNSDNRTYVPDFLNNKLGAFSANRTVVAEPKKNLQKRFEATYRVVVPMQNLYKNLIQNKLYTPEPDPAELVDVEAMDNMVLPTIIVVPFKKDGESYDEVLQSDFDRRIAVAKVQDGFEKRNITTVDLSGKVAAMKRRSEYELTNADSNDKQLLLSSGADVYVTVDINKDMQPSGSRVALIMKAYETSSGSILASRDGFTNRYRTNAVDMLCSYAVEDNLTPFLDDITKNFNKQVTSMKRVVLQISIGGNSMMTMSDPVGPNNYRLSDIIRQWVRVNSEKGKYHLQGIVDEGMIFDYVMIPPKDQDGFMMDAAQFAFIFQSFLIESQNIPCSSRVDGNTIYITID